MVNPLCDALVIGLWREVILGTVEDVQYGWEFS